MLNVKRVFLLLILTTLLLPSLVFAQTPDIVNTTAEGVGVIVDGNTALARDQAIKDALRIAVEQAVGTMVASETLVQNYEVLRDQIYSKTKGYIQNYKVIDEKTEDTLFRVTIQAIVAQGNLKNDLMALDLLMARKNMPRVMIMVAEQNVGMQYYSFWWGLRTEHTDMTVSENTLMGLLGQKGFIVIDHAVKTGRVEIEKPYRVESLSNEAIVSIGKQFEAEVVIYGKALAKAAGSVAGSSMKSAQADISLRAVNTDNGHVLASVTTNAAAVHPSKITAGTNALKIVTESSAEHLMEQILDRWNQDLMSGGMIHLILSNVGEYSRLVKFKETVQKKIRGVSGLYQRDYSEGVATLDIKIASTSQALADELVVLDYGGFYIDVTGITQNRIELKMK